MYPFWVTFPENLLGGLLSGNDIHVTSRTPRMQGMLCEENGVKMARCNNKKHDKCMLLYQQQDLFFLD